MQLLPTQLKAQDRTLKELKRQGPGAIYELLGRGGVLYGLEVIIIKIHPAETIMAKEYPQREGYPANEEWGSLAWSYGRNDLKNALKRFNGLCSELCAPEP